MGYKMFEVLKLFAIIKGNFLLKPVTTMSFVYN
jgi:hypothetical protein